MTWRWASLATAALALGAAPGCSDRACIRLSHDELGDSGGSGPGAPAATCPDRTEALRLMTPSCGAAVIAVTGDGEQEDGDLCCYDVVERDHSDDAPPCAIPRPSTGPSTAVSSGVTTAVSSVASSSSSSGVGGQAGAGGTGGGQPTGCEIEGQPCAPACGAPEISPSAGSCVSVGGVVECNPVTNEGCNATVGEACDATRTGFACYPAPNIEDACQACGGDGSSYCKAGYTCFGTCFRYCCKATDCGSPTAICYKEPFPSSLVTDVGVCIEPAGMGGAGGAG